MIRQCFAKPGKRLSSNCFILIASLIIIMTYCLYISNSERRYSSLDNDRADLLHLKHAPKSEKRVVKQKNKFQKKTKTGTVAKRNKIDDKHTEGKNLRLPKCIIMGVRKGGTLALLKLMNIHPDIVITKANELHFFDYEENYERGLEFYKRYWRPTTENEVPTEKTPAYFHVWNVPERVYKMKSSVKLLVTLRNPVKRIVSEYLMNKSRFYRKGNNGTIPELRTHVLNVDGNINTNSIMVNISTYHAHFSQWLKYFPREQIHIVDGDKFGKSPHKELGAIETFLGIRHFISHKNLVYVASKGFYCPVDKNRKPVCLGPGKGHIHPEIDPDLLEKLNNYFKPLNEQLFELVGRRFDWD